MAGSDIPLRTAEMQNFESRYSRDLSTRISVGFSRLRMKFKNMPTHLEIKKFGTVLSKELGYKIIDEVPDSRVVLLSYLEKPIKLL